MLALFGGPPSVTSLNARKWPFYSGDVEPAVLDKIRTGNIAATNVDKDIIAFERSFVDKQCPDHAAIFCGSGTAGLLSAYFALGLDKGAEVLVPSNTFRATVTPLLLLNLVPVFCDTDPVTGTIDIEDAARKLTSKTQALVVTHMWGHPANMSQAMEFVAKNKLALVEDCSHAHGARYNDTPVGTFGDVSIFSLGTKKMVSGGIAGIVLTKNQDIYERASIFSQPKPVALSKIKSEYIKSFADSGFGVNFRGSPISAILASEHLDRLNYTITVKNENLSRIQNGLNQYLPDLICPTRNNSFTSGTWYAFNCRWTHQTIKASRIYDALLAEGVRVHRPSGFLHNETVFHDQSLLTSYDKLPFQEGSCGETEELFTSLIGWDTRELYDPAFAITDQYILAFEKISKNLHRLTD